MAKHVEKVGKIEDFKAPWETDAGKVEIDEDRLKKFIFNLTVDKAKAYDKLEEKDAEITKVTSDRDEAKQKLEDGGSTDLKQELKDERAKTKTQTERADTAERNLLIRDIADDKGLSKEQAERLRGTTKEELESDADDLVKTFGIEGRVEDEGGDDAETLRRSPRKGINPAAPKETRTPTKPVDYEQAAAQLKSNRMF